jgi:hypothetical protein
MVKAWQIGGPPIASPMYPGLLDVVSEHWLIEMRRKLIPTSPFAFSEIVFE